MKRTRGCLMQVGLVVLSVLFTCSMIELAARGYQRLTNLYTDARLFRLSQPAPYQNADYFSAEFIAESWTQPGGWEYGAEFILPNDYAGTWFNVVNHRRVTTDLPATFQHTVYLFGGSTVYDSEVPDGYTIASYLQRTLNETQPGMYRVENMGVTTVTSTQEVARLKTIDLQPGDIVILYHGVNDAMQGIYYKMPDGQMAVNLLQRYETMPPLQRLKFDLWRDYSPTLASAALLLYPYSMSVPEHLTDPEQLARLRATVTISYERNLSEAVAYTERHGATLLVFLQPNLFTPASPTRYEQVLQRNPYIVPPGMALALTEGYAALRQANHPARWTDMSAAFDGNDGELFLDYCHINHEGNRLAAAVMANEIE